MRGRAVRTSWSALFLFLLVVAHQWQCLSSHRPRDTVPSRWDSQSDHTEPPLPGGFAVRPGHAVPGGRSLLRQHVGASGHCYGNRCRDHRRPKTRADQKLVSYRAPQARANSSYTCHGGLDADLTLVSVVHGIPVDAYEAITANHLNWTARWDAAYCQFQVRPSPDKGHGFSFAGSNAFCLHHASIPSSWALAWSSIGVSLYLWGCVDVVVSSAPGAVGLVEASCMEQSDGAPGGFGLQGVPVDHVDGH